MIGSGTSTDPHYTCNCCSATGYGYITCYCFDKQDTEPYLEDIDESELVPRERRTIIRTILRIIKPRSRSPPYLDLWKDFLTLHIPLNKLRELRQK